MLENMERCPTTYVVHWFKGWGPYWTKDPGVAWASFSPLYVYKDNCDRGASHSLEIHAFEI